MTAINKMTKEELIAHVAKQNETIRVLRSQNAQHREYEAAPWYDQMIEALTVEAEVNGRDGPYLAKLVTDKDVAYFCATVANGLAKKIDDGAYGLVAQQEKAANALKDALRRRDGSEFSQQRIDNAKLWLAGRNQALAQWQDAFDALKEHHELIVGQPMRRWGTDAQSNVAQHNGDAPTLSAAELAELKALGIDPAEIEIGTELNTNGIETDAA